MNTDEHGRARTGTDGHGRTRTTDGASMTDRDDTLEWRDSPEVVALSEALKRVRRHGVRLSRRLDGGLRVFADPPVGLDDPERMDAYAEIVALTIAAREDLALLTAAESIPLTFWERHICGAWVQLRAETLAEARAIPAIWCRKCRARWTPVDGLNRDGRD